MSYVRLNPFISLYFSQRSAASVPLWAVVVTRQREKVESVCVCWWSVFDKDLTACRSVKLTHR